MKTAETDGTIIEFLLGSHPYDGVWVGDQHPEKEGWFWWRKALRDYASHPSPMSAEQVEELGYYYPLFKFFSDEHGLSLLDSQLQDVIHECKKFIEPASPSVKADGWVSVEEKQRLEQIIELKEKERQEWADLCIKKQRRIDELENPLGVAPPHQNNNYKQ